MIFYVAQKMNIITRQKDTSQWKQTDNRTTAAQRQQQQQLVQIDIGES